MGQGQNLAQRFSPLMSIHFRNVYTVNCLGVCSLYTISARANMLSAHFKRFRFLSETQPIACAGIIWPSWRCPVEIGVQGTNIKNITDSLATAIGVNNKLSFICDPGVLFLVLASMKLWQVNLQVGSVSHPLQFLTVHSSASFIHNSILIPYSI